MAVRATNQLEAMITLLDVLKIAAHKIWIPARAGLNRATQTLGHLLQRLPEELLAQTMRFACSDVFDLIKLSHVSRRFRNVALSLADMWSFISSDLPTEIVRLCLERSKSASLHVFFAEMENNYDLDNFYTLSNNSNTPDPESQLKTYIHETARRCSRWTNIKFAMPVSSHRYFATASYMLYWVLAREFYADLHVPRLASLSILHSGCLLDDRDHEAYGLSRAETIDVIHFYHSWKAPNLRTLTFSGIIPAPIPGASIEVLHLDIRVDEQDIDFYVALQELFYFLQETPSLRKLKIYTYPGGTKDADEPCSLQTVTLQNLQELTFVVNDRPLPPENVVLFILRS